MTCFLAAKITVRRVWGFFYGHVKYMFKKPVLSNIVCNFQHSVYIGIVSQIQFCRLLIYT